MCVVRESGLVSSRRRDERAFSPYERVPTDAKREEKTGGKQEENERKKIFKIFSFPSFVVDLYLLFCFFSMIFIK